MVIVVVPLHEAAVPVAGGLQIGEVFGGKPRTLLGRPEQCLSKIIFLKGHPVIRRFLLHGRELSGVYANYEGLRRACTPNEWDTVTVIALPANPEFFGPTPSDSSLCRRRYVRGNVFVPS